MGDCLCTSVVNIYKYTNNKSSEEGIFAGTRGFEICKNWGEKERKKKKRQ